LLEAIYIGSPVIATEVGGMPEIIRTVGAGTLVPPNRPRSLAEAIAKMLASEPEQRGSRAIRERVGANYSFRRLMSEYEAVYSATLAGRGQA
jgi:glycosyltransferase involved in cell wall biosynthesis